MTPIKFITSSKNSENDMVKAYFVGLVIGIIIGFIETFAFCYKVNKQNINDLKLQAIKSGHAEYVVDEFGLTTFQFKDYTDKKEDLQHE